MDATLGKVQLAISSAFPGIEIDLKVNRPSRRITGKLVWAGFEGMPHIDRQHIVWESMGSVLSGDERARFGAVVTLTPAELSSARTALAV